MKLTEEKNAILEKYMEGILAWNEKVNLTNITDPAEFRIKHNADSLMCVDFPEFLEAETVIDVGTGGGFPGIPLGIKNITLVHGRAEDAARTKEHREKYDLCVSRAVSNLATLSEYCLPFIKVGGYLLAYKGPGAEEEVKEASKALKILGGSLVDIRETSMEEYGLDHKILVIKKEKNTPKAYPRKAGTPLKEPLK